MVCSYGLRLILQSVGRLVSFSTSFLSRARPSLMQCRLYFYRKYALQVKRAPAKGRAKVRGWRSLRPLHQGPALPQASRSCPQQCNGLHIFTAAAGHAAGLRPYQPFREAFPFSLPSIFIRVQPLRTFCTLSYLSAPSGVAAGLKGRQGPVARPRTAREVTSSNYQRHS